MTKGQITAKEGKQRAKARLHENKARVPPKKLDREPPGTRYSCAQLAFNKHLFAIPIEPALQGEPRIVRFIPREDGENMQGEFQFPRSVCIPTLLALQSGICTAADTDRLRCGVVIGVAPAWYPNLAVGNATWEDAWYNPYKNLYRTNETAIKYDETPDVFTVLKRDSHVALVIAQMLKKQLKCSILLNPDANMLHKPYSIPIEQVFFLPHFRDDTSQGMSIQHCAEKIRQSLAEHGLLPDQRNNLPLPPTRSGRRKRQRVSEASTAASPSSGAEPAPVHASASADVVDSVMDDVAMHVDDPIPIERTAADLPDIAEDLVPAHALASTNVINSVMDDGAIHVDDLIPTERAVADLLDIATDSLPAHALDLTDVVDDALDDETTCLNKSSDTGRPDFRSPQDILAALWSQLYLSSIRGRYESIALHTLPSMVDESPVLDTSQELYLRLFCRRTISKEQAVDAVKFWESLVGDHPRDQVTWEELMKVHEAWGTRQAKVDPETTQRVVTAFVDHLRLFRKLQRNEDFWWTTAALEEVVDFIEDKYC